MWNAESSVQAKIEIDELLHYSCKVFEWNYVEPRDITFPFPFGKIEIWIAEQHKQVGLSRSIYRCIWIIVFVCVLPLVNTNQAKIQHQEHPFHNNTIDINRSYWRRLKKKGVVLSCRIIIPHRFRLEAFVFLTQRCAIVKIGSTAISQWHSSSIIRVDLFPRLIHSFVHV